MVTILESTYGIDGAETPIAYVMKRISGSTELPRAGYMSTLIGGYILVLKQVVSYSSA